MNVVDGRPLPVPDALTEPFWAGCANGVLLVPECEDSAHRFFVPQPCCPRCRSPKWRWVESPGVGSVYSFTVVHRAPNEALAAPYVVAIVELDDGWDILTNVVDCDPESVVIGLRVELALRPLSDGTVLPFFRPANGAL